MSSKRISMLKKALKRPVLKEKHLLPKVKPLLSQLLSKSLKNQKLQLLKSTTRARVLK
uniref:Predicted protein n=1 Tax=Hordeum vulgare subsp. vulgare TaxID=112509 RepID=F2DFQ6_HORVV|nr:predicted protein [Hordeum vulgare subsp. vulgare]